jgi:hypothetical protein
MHIKKEAIQEQPSKQKAYQVENVLNTQTTFEEEKLDH